MKKALLILVCLMAMVVNVNAQTVSYYENYENGNIAIETSNIYLNHEIFSAVYAPFSFSRVLILMPIERIDEFVSLLEKSITYFEKYEKVVENLDIRYYDESKVKFKDLHFKTKIAVSTKTKDSEHFRFIENTCTFDKNINFSFYCKTYRKKPCLLISGEADDEEIKLEFNSTYDILKLIKELKKDYYTKLAKDKKRKEELLKIEQAKEAKRKKQVENALQKAFN